MNDKEKFLKELEANLSSFKKKDKKYILEKYSWIIDRYKEQGYSDDFIFNEIGSAEKVAIKEFDRIESIKVAKKNKKSTFRKIYEFLDKDLSESLKESLKKRKEKRIENKKKKEEASKEKEIKEEIIHNVKEIENNVVEEKNEVNREVKEEADTTDETKVVYVENTVTLSKGKRVLATIVNILLIGVWMLIASLFFTSCFAYLDGVKIIGLPLFFIGLTLLVFWIIMMINQNIFRLKKNIKLNLFMVIFSALIMAFGISYSVYKVYHVDMVSDPSDKYTMTSKTDVYNLPTNGKFYISFNSNYKTQYSIEYNDNYKGRVKVEVKYYEPYYDYYSKKSNNGLYVSLRTDFRDTVSRYISDLKDNVVYSNDELSRYSVKITVATGEETKLEIN